MARQKSAFGSYTCMALAAMLVGSGSFAAEYQFMTTGAAADSAVWSADDGATVYWADIYPVGFAISIR